MKQTRAISIAEKISLGLSTLILLGLTFFLIYEIIQPQSPLVAVTGHAVAVAAQQQESIYIMPVEIRNGSDITVKYVKLELAAETGSGKEIREIEIDYLGSHSNRTIYIYFQSPVSQGNISIRPMYYQLD